MSVSQVQLSNLPTPTLVDLLNSTYNTAQRGLTLGQYQEALATITQIIGKYIPTTPSSTSSTTLPNAIAFPALLNLIQNERSFLRRLYSNLADINYLITINTGSLCPAIIAQLRTYLDPIIILMTAHRQEIENLARVASSGKLPATTTNVRVPPQVPEYSYGPLLLALLTHEDQLITNLIAQLTHLMTLTPTPCEASQSQIGQETLTMLTTILDDSKLLSTFLSSLIAGQVPTIPATTPETAAETHANGWRSPRSPNRRSLRTSDRDFSSPGRPLRGSDQDMKGPGRSRFSRSINESTPEYW